MVARSASVGHRGARGWIVSAATVVLVIIPGVVPPHPGAGFVWSPDVLALNAVAAAILMGRHQRPLAVLAAVIGVVAVSVPLGLFNPGLVLAAGVAVYTTMLYATRRRGFVLTALVALAMLAFVFVDGYSGLQNVLTVLLGGAIGDAVRTQRDYVASVTERAERAERTRDAVAGQRVAETRLAIARDLHDVVAHQISVINLHAGVAASSLRNRPADAEKSLAIIRSASRTALTEIGDLMATLRDPTTAIGPFGLSQLDDVVREFASHGMEVAVHIDGDPYELPASIDVTALRVVQEALTNAHKHGTGHRAHVLIGYLPRALRITVSNPTASDGAGARHLGMNQGLIGMRERVDSVRGALRYGADGTGRWLLVADLPTEPAHDDLDTPDDLDAPDDVAAQGDTQ
ncbi:histidine kinase [Rhodococcus erythropolis]|uniref:sensor histidine kinase n=1 Tax=Rhodococcus erythropolis TaxID=1833 RepID=UPI001E41D200|nr:MULTISPECIES: histidine kinase [Rhodococcus erythropolis group]MCD2107070.1 histidine kinase [Rhodococcus qingshengii]MCZ4526499.1 histidine kinase [Rhodococcus erythropolis]